jgi:predicted nucleic acid-binding protein
MTKIVKKSAIGIILHPVLVEFYYKHWQKFGYQSAQTKTLTLQQTNFSEYKPLDTDVFNIGKLKIKHPRLSLVDCYLIVAAINTSSTILTTDGLIKDIAKSKVVKLEY